MLIREVLALRGKETAAISSPRSAGIAHVQTLVSQADLLPVVEQRLMDFDIPFVEALVEEGGVRVTQVRDFWPVCVPWLLGWLSPASCPYAGFTRSLAICPVGAAGPWCMAYAGR